MRFQDQRGFSLIEGMIAAAILAGIALMAASMFSQQNSVTKYNQTVSKINSYHSNLRKLYADINNCNAMIVAGASNSGTISSAGVGMTSLNICCKAGSSNCSANLSDTCSKIVNNQLSISSTDLKSYISVGAYTDKTNQIQLTGFRLYNPDPAAPAYVASMSGQSQTKNYEIRVLYTIVNAKGGPSQVEKSIPISLKFGSNSFFQGCSTNESSAKDTVYREICEGLNAQTGTNGKLVEWFKGEEGIERCEIVLTNNAANPNNFNCPPNEVLVGITSIGTKICRTAASMYDESDAISPNQATNPLGTTVCTGTTTLKLVKSGTKMVLQCL